MFFKDITVIDSTYTPLEHRYLITEGQTIVYLSDQEPVDYEGDMYDGRNKVVLPGFFNGHTHVPMTILRGYGEGLPLDRWLNDYMFPYEELLTSDDIYWSSMLGIAELIKSGCVSFTDMYMKLTSIADAVDAFGIKANLSFGEMAFDEEAAYPGGEAHAETMLLQEYIRNCGHDRLNADVSIHSIYTSTEKMIKGAVDFAREHGFRFHTHLSETSSEVETCKAKHQGATPIEYVHNLGMFEVPTTAAHGVWLEPKDFEILKAQDVSVVHCPSSNLKLGSGIAPVKEMQEYEIRVGLGTDGAASNNNLNFLEEMNLTALLHKGYHHDPLILQPQQVLEMTCRNGALAQGRSDCGTVEVGNRADIIVFDMDRPHLQPIHNPLSNIIYSAQAADICMTMIDGKIVYEDGVFPHIDMEEVLYQINRIKHEKGILLSQ
jgi:5-methylthioadenosine/S-adenosylhomocysteine deaminase